MEKFQAVLNKFVWGFFLGVVVSIFFAGVACMFVAVVNPAWFCGTFFRYVIGAGICLSSVVGFFAVLDEME